ncbi:hypothetical protein AHAS_Ahas17G0212500 [Arachis hypogaea]
MGTPTMVVSTDPAHSLSNSFAQKVERETAKTVDMKEKGADPYDLKQQKNVLAESRMMIPDFHKRLKATLVDLKGALAELEESNEKEGPEIDDARNTIAEVEKWVEEKTGGRIPASTVASVSIELLRKGGPDAVCQHLYSLKKGSACVVNATSERDMAVFALEMIKAELMEKHFLCRTAASFVSSRIGIISRPPILPKDLGITRERNGSLIVVGSYVPKTTKQVEELKLQCGHFLKSIEVSVEKLAMRPVEEREEENAPQRLAPAATTMAPAASPGNNSGNFSLTPPSRFSLSLLRTMVAASGSTVARDEEQQTPMEQGRGRMENESGPNRAEIEA